MYTRNGAQWKNRAKIEEEATKFKAENKILDKYLEAANEVKTAKQTNIDDKNKIVKVLDTIPPLVPKKGINQQQLFNHANQNQGQ